MEVFGLRREGCSLFDRIPLIGLTAALLYLAHSLPGVVPARREKEI